MGVDDIRRALLLIMRHPLWKVKRSNLPTAVNSRNIDHGFMRANAPHRFSSLLSIKLHAIVFWR
jgi:hypothetical protein